MSVPPNSHPAANGGSDDRLAPEDRAAIAAVDGLGSLSPFDAEEVDPSEVAEFEAAAGALFMAFNQQRILREGVQAPDLSADLQARLQGRLERAADHYVASRDGDADAFAAERALGAADAESGWRGPSEPSLEPGLKPSLVPGPAPLDSSPATSRPFSLVPALAGWAAAAALLVGLLTMTHRVSELENGSATVQPPATRMTQLLYVAPDVVDLAWAPLGAGKRLGGSVVWSDERNEGYMKIKGLPVNDPSVSQYQLWIFRGDDPGAEPHPVDGGVFDIAETGEVVVPISAKLAVGRAGIFAVTVEKPGGVVVSEREQIVALAQRAV
jgi:hypothetical protein